MLFAYLFEEIKLCDYFYWAIDKNGPLGMANKSKERTY